MLQRASAQWWILLLRGLLAIALGIAALVAPAAMALALALLFGAYALIDGVIAIAASLRMSHEDGRWRWLLVEGIIGVLFGAVAIAIPAISLLTLVYLMGFWALATGITAITTAVRIRARVPGTIWWIVSGLISIAFGVWVLLAPGAGALVLVAIFGWYAMFFGLANVAIALLLRTHHLKSAAG